MYIVYITIFIFMIHKNDCFHAGNIQNLLSVLNQTKVLNLIRKY